MKQKPVDKFEEALKRRIRRLNKCWWDSPPDEPVRQELAGSVDEVEHILEVYRRFKKGKK